MVPKLGDQGEGGAAGLRLKACYVSGTLATEGPQNGDIVGLVP